MKCNNSTIIINIKIMAAKTIERGSLLRQGILGARRGSWVPAEFIP